MERLLFKDTFWGSDFTCHAGYNAVIQRLRDGRHMCKDVEELLKMRAIAEEKYGKELVTIARKAGGHTEISGSKKQNNYKKRKHSECKLSPSTLRTSFDQLKKQIETIGNFHIQLSDILKEEVKKIETFRERQREQRKKFESIMEKVQKIKVTSYKKTMESKRNYELRCREADEAEEVAEKTTVATKNSEKIRHRAKHCRQTTKEAEKLYFNNVVQLENVRQDWAETHKSTCEVFQQMEGDRISVLRMALWDHCNYLSQQCVNDDEFYEEVRKHLEQCDITIDNNYFIETKGTGSKPPDTIVFESYYQDGMSRQSNGQARTAGGGEDVMRRSVDIRIDSPQNSRSSVISFGELEIADGGYAPLTGHQQDTSLATFTADEESYMVLYTYAAQDVDELSVSRGEVVQVLERGEDGWWLVERDGLTGIVPGNYLGKI